MKHRNSRWGTRADAKDFGLLHPQVERQNTPERIRVRSKRKYECKKMKGDHDWDHHKAVITELAWFKDDPMLWVSIDVRCRACGKHYGVWGLELENLGIDKDQFIRDNQEDDI